MARPVRQWEFWRAGFWKRPVLVAAVSLLPLFAAAWLLPQIGSAWSAGQALSSGETCTAARAEDCLLEVSGVLSGPHYSRGPGSEWWLQPANGGLLDTGMAPPRSTALEPYDGEVVTGLVHDDELVAIRLPDGGVVRSREVGLDGVLWFAFLGLMAVCIGLMGLAHAWGSWRRTGSLIAVEGHGFDDSRVGVSLFVAACVAFVPVLFGGLPLFFGAPAWVVLTATGVGAALLLVATLRGRRLRPPG